MDHPTILLNGAIFLFVCLSVLCAHLVWSNNKLVEKRKLKTRLLSISAGGKHGKDKLNLYQKKVFSKAGVLEAFFLSLPRLSRLDRLLLRSGRPISATNFILSSLLLGVVGVTIGFYLHRSAATGLVLGGIFLLVPLLWLRSLEQKSLAKFQSQLPEALDLLSRALRSGHALSSGLEMIAEEMSDPLGGEFQAVVDEISLGLTLNEALENLCSRVPSSDLRFLTISILVQKETGGNIAEILDNISKLIRERVKFKRHVDTLTAEGKVSGVILVLLPIVLFCIIYFLNYKYISMLWIEPDGQKLLAGGIVMMILGVMMIRRIIRIEM
ncbi:MAG: type II secretion system F family protein [Deltaproteobacteria bacterium]|jgi:tight adherence protein B|nr:type II secretion system F family protein [Deltaproteobacteria bacterium]